MERKRKGNRCVNERENTWQRQRMAQTCSGRWHHSRFQTAWEQSRCYACVTAQSWRRRRAGNKHTARLISDEQHSKAEPGSSLAVSILLLSALSCVLKISSFFVLAVPGGWRTQVSPWVLCVPELQGGDWGQGYLRLSRAIETLLVRHLHWSF